MNKFKTQCCWNTVAKRDPYIDGATQSPTMDGPFGDQWSLWVFAENIWELKWTNFLITS